MKDWTGNSRSTYITLGASNHTDKERQSDDFYATDPSAIDKLVAKHRLPTNIYEPACGEGHLSKRLVEFGHKVVSTDLIDRGFGAGGIDFLAVKELPRDCKCILTNPPYKYALEFIKHSLELLPDDGECVMLLKTTFLEGKKRYKELFSEHPPRYIYQFSERLLCAKNADFEGMRAGGGSAVSYAWFVFTPCNKSLPIVDWI